MNIREIIQTIDSFPEEGSIFAEKIENKYSPESEAIVIEMSDEELKEKTDDVANRKCPGKSYFLELFLVKEFIEDIYSNYKDKQLTLSDIVECVIYYAENDSYPEKFFG